jgi:hypothetical protein
MSTTQSPPGLRPRRVVVDPDTGVRYWDQSDCPPERLSPGSTPDHPARSGGMSIPDYRIYRARQSSATTGQHRRAPRAAGARRRGSRRSSSSSRTSGSDPGDSDPEPARVCGGCDKPLIGYAPQARFHSEACRKRAERARRRAAQPSRPVWPSIGIEPPAVLATLMADPPHGVVTEAVSA